MKKMVIVLIALDLISVQSQAVSAEAIVADHEACSLFEQLPDSIIDTVSSRYNIFYIHTSHGSQIMSGLTLLENENSLYDPPYFSEYGDDLGHNGDTSWVPPTRSYLDSHPDCNVAMFSWCGGVSDNTETGINIYLNAMQGLETEYPDVVFIYMTGHLDGSGPDGNLYIRNNQIRDFCVANDKILFDFADIESYDPDGNYYPDESDACGWCYDWCASHTCPACGCAHSHCFNCYQKGRAWWWMMARVAGYDSEPQPRPMGDVNNDLAVDVSDAVYIVNYAFAGGPAPDPLAVGDANCDESVDVSDAVYIINYAFASGNPPGDPDGNGVPDCTF
jgi:hypothetical protein